MTRGAIFNKQGFWCFAYQVWCLIFKKGLGLAIPSIHLKIIWTLNTVVCIMCQFSCNINDVQNALTVHWVAFMAAQNDPCCKFSVSPFARQEPPTDYCDVTTCMSSWTAGCDAGVLSLWCIAIHLVSKKWFSSTFYVNLDRLITGFEW